MASGERIKLDPTFPVRLRAARLKAGLSLEDLAQKLGGIITRQAIAKYEKGLSSPSPEVLHKLNQVLEIPPPPDIPEELPEKEDWLEFTLPPGSEHYIKKPLSKSASFNSTELVRELRYLSASTRASRLEKEWFNLQTPAYWTETGEAGEDLKIRPDPRITRKQFNALKIRLEEKMRNYLWLEKLLRQERIFSSPLNRDINDFSEAEKAAEEVRQQWNLGSGAVNNLLTFLEERGIKTFKISGPDNFESLCGFFQGQPLIAVSEALPVDRIRFKTAFELAEILFGPDDDPARIKLYNRFAAAFLLPARVLEEYFLPVGRKIALSELAELKLRYGVSFQAIMRRAFDLELVTERRFRSFREMMNEKGWLWKEPVEYQGIESPTRFRRLLHYAVSSEILDLEKAAALAEVGPEELKKEMVEIF